MKSVTFRPGGVKGIDFDTTRTDKQLTRSLEGYADSLQKMIPDGRCLLVVKYPFQVEHYVQLQGIFTRLDLASAIHAVYRGLFARFNRKMADDHPSIVTILNDMRPRDVGAWSNCLTSLVVFSAKKETNRSKIRACIKAAGLRNTIPVIRLSTNGK